MPTLRKRGNSFEITVSVGYDINGRQIRKYATFTPPEGVTPKKAEKLAHAFAMDFEKKCQGSLDLNENMKFEDLVEWYFENYAPNRLKPCTIYTYKGQVDKHLLPVFGNKKLKEFSSGMLTRFFNELSLNPSTCKKLYTILESIFTRAVEQGFIKETPCRNVILPKQDKVKRQSLTAEQAKELLKMVEPYSQLNTIIKVLLFTGMRSGEALGLQWQDIDFDRHLIHVVHSLADVGGKHFLQEPKTKTSVRYIGMSQALETILIEHRAEQENVKAIVGESYQYPDMVFTSATGNYLDRASLLTQFKRLIKDTDFSWASLHTLRHANATLLINNGVDLKIVSEHLGHSGVSVTADVYSDILADTKKKVADLIALELE